MWLLKLNNKEQYLVGALSDAILAFGDKEKARRFSDEGVISVKMTPWSIDNTEWVKEGLNES